MSRKDRSKGEPEPDEEFDLTLIEASPERMPPPEVPIRFQMDPDREALRLISWPGMRSRQVGKCKAFRKTSEKKIVSKALVYHKRLEVSRGGPWSPPATIICFKGKKRVGHKNGAAFVHKVGRE